ncbi:Hypothetical_protein [Hexamita inflata]|uniref:Hypothetical_protein n=1 Tax=Hexamita inflata TaxID=28002 RepID=A0ABP1GWY5_9EUKA
MSTQQRPSRALTESLADQFHLIRQLTFKKLVLAQFLFARYFLRLAREVVPLYCHCLVVVAFDASFHQLDIYIGQQEQLFDCKVECYSRIIIKQYKCSYILFTPLLSLYENETDKNNNMIEIIFQ